MRRLASWLGIAVSAAVWRPRRFGHRRCLAPERLPPTEISTRVASSASLPLACSRTLRSMRACRSCNFGAPSAANSLRQALRTELFAALVRGFGDAIGVKREAVAGESLMRSAPAACWSSSPSTGRVGASSSISPLLRRTIGGQCPALTYSSTRLVRSSTP